MPEDTKKSRPSLGLTIFGSFIAGGLGGALIGSGLEDLLTNFDLPQLIQQSIEYTSTVCAGLGSLILSTWSVLQYYNKDEHEGALVINVEDPAEQKQTYVKPELDLKSIANTVEKLTYSIENKGIAQNIYTSIARALQQNPLKNAQRSYELKKQGFIVDSFEIFKQFNYEGKIVDPKQTIDEFFAIGEELYNLFIDRVSRTSEVLTQSRANPFSTKNEHQQWSQKFRNNLEKELELASNMALWATYLSKRGGIVGSKVNAKLVQFGVSNPNHLSSDVTVLGRNILEFYDAMEENQLRQYQQF